MIPARVVLTILGFFGYINLYAMRVNLSVAMVAMVGTSQSSNEVNRSKMACPELLNNNNSKINETIIPGEFNWDSTIQGQVLGSFFYGYILTQIPGGVLAEKYGAKWIYGFGIFTTAALTLLTPVAARWSVWALVAVRVGEGLAGGVVYPAMNVLIGRWIPKIERSRVSTVLSMGGLFGTLITNAVTGVLSESSFLGGWPSIFYVTGLLGCIWFLFWAFLIHETPENHPRISTDELLYIQESKEKLLTRNVKIPWKNIWSSMPMWAIIIAHFGSSWGWYTMLTMLPTYISNVLHLSLEYNGLASGLPYLVMAVFAVPASFVADALRARGRLQITTIRKLFTGIGFFGPSICLLIITFVGCQPLLIVVLFSFSFGINGFVYSGYSINHVDMSPKFAGTLMGITNSFASLPGFLAPALTGAILKKGQTLRNWGMVYIITSAIYFLSATFYIIFASAELQPWNYKQESDIDEENIQSKFTSSKSSKF